MPNFYNRLKARKFSTVSDTAVEISAYNSATPNFTIDAGGKLNWSSGSAVADTNLYRSAANVLKTDDSFDVASGKTYKIDGTDVLTSSAVLSSSTAATIGASTGTTTINNGIVLKQVLETATIDSSTALSASATNIDVLTSSIYYFTGTPSANFAINIRGNSSVTDLNNILSTGQTLTISIIVDRAGNTHKLSTVNVNGSSQTINWFGGTAPSAGNALDIYSVTVLKTATSTYKVFASQAKFA
jgi:hypothetical protein